LEAFSVGESGVLGRLFISISSLFHTHNYDAPRTDLSDPPLPNIYPMYLIGIGETSEDKDPPLIGTHLRTPTGEVLPNQKVKVAVNVTDAKSGIENVTLSYTTDEGTTWTNTTMNNVSASTYVGKIPGFEAGTHVQYQIIAYDNANNKAIDNNKNEYYVYTVITEFQLSIILIFMTTTLIAAIFTKKKRRRF